MSFSSFSVAAFQNATWKKSFRLSCIYIEQDFIKIKLSVWSAVCTNWVTLFFHSRDCSGKLMGNYSLTIIMTEVSDACLLQLLLRLFHTWELIGQVFQLCWRAWHNTDWWHGRHYCEMSKWQKYLHLIYTVMGQYSYKQIFPVKAKTVMS